MIQRIGVQSANYCLISFKKGKAFEHVKFDANSLFKDDKDLLFKKLDALNPPVNCCPALHDDFDQAAEAFKTEAIRITSKKVMLGTFIFPKLGSCNENLWRYHGTQIKPL